MNLNFAADLIDAANAVIFPEKPPVEQAFQKPS